MSKKKAIIIGAGPAGLTAAYELLDKTDIIPVIYETTGTIGGISGTIDYKGNKIDIGGHRFFSKSDRVMDWWLKLFPLQGKPSKDDIILDRNIPLSKEPHAPDPEKQDQVMLVRSRLSRIFFLRKFFNYPISLEMQTLKNLGLTRIIKIGLSYITARIFKIKHEKTLEDFFINRFGKELYLIFFKDYTEKVWGVPCSRIKPEWGSQRIKGLSVTKAVAHALKQIFRKDKSIEQKSTETSLIEQFMYPKFGPGQMWEKVAAIIKEKGGELYLDHRVVALENNHDRITGVMVKNKKTGEEFKNRPDYVFSTMPVKDLINGMVNKVPPDVHEISNGLIYRNFITVGLLLKKLKIKNETLRKTINNIVPDTWIYIQEREVKVGRLQIFNNWSPYMVKDPDTVWIGLEYFCDEGDELWNMTDEEITRLAINESSAIDIIEKEDVLDHIVIRVPKTYPAYFGTYDRFDVIRNYTDEFHNLFLIGRNGMHRYNNQDHSMLTAIVAVENIINNVKSKDNIWNVNIEQEYHEEK
ncbi:MAG: NAD(P)/FAD-dependent oxidoreductase [Candidatus Aminicenantes bacterium]|nr:MAG: NAD(P)/FAD-dependent oxidoreductase [Candidatus Aminicenantes bacterium]